ncbi:MAG: adenylosuccinate synthetase [Candidatus Levyibacteriota bacterium]
MLSKIQDDLFKRPHNGIQKDIDLIYKKNKILLGWPKGIDKIFCHLSRKNSVAIVGVALGDEGKGRFVDNEIKIMLEKRGVKKIAVIRFQGGNNAGHTIEKKGLRLALHLVPSGVLHPQAIGIMDQGMVIHPQDLRTEIEYIEKSIRSLKGRLFLSENAILCTDLERAEEILNSLKRDEVKGGTGRGISPSYAHHYDRLGLKIYDLLDNNWKNTLKDYYNRYKKEFSVFGINLATVQTPDYKPSRNGKMQKRKVGSEKEFLKNLKEIRDWLIKRNFVINTFLMHQKIYNNNTIGIIFEGSQAQGLDAWLGTRPDVTSSNTSMYGLREGTALWSPKLIEDRIGVFKIPYTSSVGARKMPTHVDLPKDLKDLPKNASQEQKWAAYVRETANEYGATTGRPRDINHLDLAFLSYNARMSGIEILVGTHLDIAKENQTIMVCTHYKNQKGDYVPYQPGLRYQKNVIPSYIKLPGWDGEKCRKAKKMEDLPINALKFLSFVQKRTGFPITIVTTGPLRENIITLS